MVHALDLHDSKGATRRLVLKLYRPDPSEPDSAWREAHILRLLAESNLPVPRVVAIDREGADSGWPALLMTQMPGRRRLRPRETQPWLRQLAQLAGRVHGLALPTSELPTYRTWGLHDPLQMPDWWADPGVWRRAIEIFHGMAPPEPAVFIHRDFHPGNVLWTGARPSALLDWLHGCRGPASVDFAHCKLNLWLDNGQEVAQRWVDLYGSSHHPYWDIADAMSWTPDPAQHGLRRARRYESFITAALTRLG